MKLTDAQFSALHTLAEFGPKAATEVRMPPAMDGSRRIKLECHFLTAPTLARLEQGGLVSVQRSEPSAPVNAVGKRGHARRSLTISITDAGRAAVAPLCQWFALCDHPATTTRSHPVLGEVPICDRCNSKMDRL
jgi:DNA-binding MarR family transcriptional regulator